MKKKVVHFFGNNRYLFISLFLNILTAVCFYSFFYPISETGDDSVMMAISSGVFGVRSAYIAFINVFIGKLIITLNGLLPFLNWYNVLQIIFIFCSLSLISYTNFKKFGLKFGLFLNVSLLSVFGYELYIRFQFTKTAGILACAGFYAIINQIDEEKKSKLTFVFGILLSVLGGMMRWQMFLLIAAIFVCCYILKMFLCCLIKNKKDIVLYIKKSVPVLIAFFIIMLMGYAAKIANTKIYTSNGWQDYITYNGLRGYVRDYPILEYKGNEEVYSKIGMSKVDYNNLTNWNIADDTFYTSELFQDIIDISKSSGGGIDIEGFFETYPMAMWNSWSLRCCVMIVLCLFAAVWNDEEERLKVIFLTLVSFLMLMTIMFYLYNSGKYGVNRVDLSTWLSALLLILSCINVKNNNVDKKAFIIGGCIISILLIIVNVQVFYRFCKFDLSDSEKKQLTEDENIGILMNLLDSSEENIYIMDAIATYQGREIGFWEYCPEGYTSNVIWLGGWYTNSPVSLYQREINQIENPFADLVDNENVFYVDRYNNYDETLAYIQDHYNEDATANLIKDIYGYKIYTFSTANVSELGETTEVNDNLKWDYEIIREGGTYYINGYAFEKGTDSFAEKIYICMEDRQSGVIRYKYGVLSENEMFDDRYAGKYSSFTARITNTQYDSYDIYIALETENGTYYLK